MKINANQYKTEGKRAVTMLSIKLFILRHVEIPFWAKCWNVQRTLFLFPQPLYLVDFFPLSAGISEWELGIVERETSPTCPWIALSLGSQQRSTSPQTSPLCLSWNNCLCAPPVHLLLSPPTTKSPFSVCFSFLASVSKKSPKQGKLA